MQPQTFVFFGQVGSGKGTQVKLLMEFLKIKDGREQLYVGTGEIFRKIAESDSDSDSSKQVVRDLLNAGKLIPDDMTNALVSEILESQLSPEKHLICDGYPRTIFQSQVFEEKMNLYMRKDIKIIFIELSRQEAMKRNLLRGRHDDTEQGLNKRFDEYTNKVIPAMNYFKDKKNFTIYTINGEQSIENVHSDIIKALGY